jgi:hypothetical protein
MKTNTNGHGPTDQLQRARVEIARRLCAAYLSYTLNEPFERCLQMASETRRPGAGWLHMADMALDMARNLRTTNYTDSI